MCGIIGIIAKKPVAAELIGGLKRLEYRGYDSAGIATLINGRIERRRAEGKLSNLVARLEREPVQGTIGIGHGDGEMFVGSDALALAPLTRHIAYLEEGDWAVVTSKKVQIFDRANNPIKREVRETALSGALIGKGNYRHFMQKEIFEQPAVIGD